MASDQPGCVTAAPALSFSSSPFGWPTLSRGQQWTLVVLIHSILASANKNLAWAGRTPCGPYVCCPRDFKEAIMYDIHILIPAIDPQAVARTVFLAFGFAALVVTVPRSLGDWMQRRQATQQKAKAAAEALAAARIVDAVAIDHDSSAFRLGRALRRLFR